MTRPMNSTKWIAVAKRASDKLQRCDDKMVRAVYMAAKINALSHAAACYAISPEAYEQAYTLEFNLIIEKLRS